MLAVTFEGARTPATAVAKSVQRGLRNGFFARFMAALRETRRQQARYAIERYVDLSSDESRLVWSNPWFLAAAPSASERPLRCPITGHPCDGDLSHLCEDYGCARKGGLSPRSDENFWKERGAERNLTHGLCLHAALEKYGPRPILPTT